MSQQTSRHIDAGRFQAIRVSLQVTIQFAPALEVCAGEVASLS
jgi:hypothetical protein